MKRRRLLAIARREWLHILRDPRSLAVALVLPVLLLLLYGYGIDMDVRRLRTAVLDLDGTQASRQLIDSFEGGGCFDVTHRITSMHDVDRLLDRAVVRVVLIIPRGYAADLVRGRAVAPLAADGSDAASAALALSYATQIVSEQARRQVDLQARASGLSVPSLAPIDARIRYWYNPELVSSAFVVPGLIALILMILSSLLTAMTIVRERERGTLESLLASPVHPAELVVGKMIPYVLIAFADVLLVLAGGRWIFDVPLNGSLALLLGLSGLFLLSALSLGMMISATAGNQLTAMIVAVTATMLPTVLLSGFVFPISAMPAPIQAITWAIPARFYLEIVRGICLKGVGLAVLWPQALVLLGTSLLLITLSVRAFRRTL